MREVRCCQVATRHSPSSSSEVTSHLVCGSCSAPIRAIAAPPGYAIPSPSEDGSAARTHDRPFSRQTQQTNLVHPSTPSAHAWQCPAGESRGFRRQGPAAAAWRQRGAEPQRARIVPVSAAPRQPHPRAAGRGALFQSPLRTPQKGTHWTVPSQTATARHAPVLVCVVAVPRRVHDVGRGHRSKPRTGRENSGGLAHARAGCSVRHGGHSPPPLAPVGSGQGGKGVDGPDWSGELSAESAPLPAQTRRERSAGVSLSSVQCPRMPQGPGWCSLSLTLHTRMYRTGEKEALYEVRSLHKIPIINYFTCTGTPV